MPEQVRIKLTKHQAFALRSDLADIEQLQMVLQTRSFSNERFARAIAADGGKDLSAFLRYRLTTEGDETYMELTPKDN